MSLHCLVYTSISNKKVSDDELKNLLKKSRLKNQELNITGMLLYLDPYFIQILEGEETAINELFSHIKQDSSHYKVKAIYKKTITKRSFPNWTMGFNKITEEDLEEMEDFCDFLQHPAENFFGKSPNETERMLEQFLSMFKDETLF